MADLPLVLLPAVLPLGVYETHRSICCTHACLLLCLHSSNLLTFVSKWLLVKINSFSFTQKKFGTRINMKFEMVTYWWCAGCPTSVFGLIAFKVCSFLPVPVYNLEWVQFYFRALIRCRNVQLCSATYGGLCLGLSMATQMEKDIKLIVHPNVMQFYHTLIALMLFHTCMTDFLSSKSEFFTI